jgi:hypothetical protein
MLKRGFLKYSGLRRFLAVLGMVVLLVTGYTATSVVSSCTAQAQVCCAGWSDSQCIGPFDGIALALGVGIFGATIAVDVTLIALTTIPVYYAQAIISFGIKVIQKIGKVIDHWYAWWDTTWNYNMSPALKDMARQITVINTDQAKQLGMFADAMNRQRADIIRKREAIQAHRETKPSANACVAGSVLGGMLQATLFAQAYGSAGPVERGQRSAHMAGTPAAAGTAADLSARHSLWKTRYCDPNENAGLTDCPGGAAPMALLDLDVTGQIFERNTIELTNEGVRTTIDDLIGNSEPRVTNTIPHTLLGNALGQQRWEEDQAYQAQRQVAYDGMYYPVSRRAPGASGGSAAAIVELAQDGGAAATDMSANPSRDEILRALNVDKARSGKEGLRNNDGPENSARHLAIQSGGQLMQMADLLDLMDHYAMVVAGQSSLKVRQQQGFSTNTEMGPAR